jgi:hypothetical protein
VIRRDCSRCGFEPGERRVAGLLGESVGEENDVDHDPACRWRRRRSRDRMIMMVYGWLEVRRWWLERKMREGGAGRAGGMDLEVESD